MRGAGKTTFGRALALNLGWTFVDTDVVLERAMGTSIKSFIADSIASHIGRGVSEREASLVAWKEFRDRERRVFWQSVCHRDWRGCVVATGGGLVETAQGRRMIRKSSPFVVFLNRHIEDIERCLNVDMARANLSEPLK